MTYSQVAPEVLRQLTAAVESRSARLLYVELLDYSNQVGSDGAIPTRALRFSTDADDPAAEVADLVAAGFLEVTPTGWQVPGWSTTAHQEPAERVEQRREFNRVKSDRSRRHGRGDHTICLPRYCPVAAARDRDQSRDGSRNQSGNPSREQVSDRSPSPPLPSPTRREGGEGRGGRESRPPRAGARSAEIPPPPVRRPPKPDPVAEAEWQAERARLQAEADERGRKARQVAARQDEFARQLGVEPDPVVAELFGDPKRRPR